MFKIFEKLSRAEDRGTGDLPMSYEQPSHQYDHGSLQSDLGDVGSNTGGATQSPDQNMAVDIHLDPYRTPEFSSAIRLNVPSSHPTNEPGQNIIGLDDSFSMVPPNMDMGNGDTNGSENQASSPASTELGLTEPTSRFRSTWMNIKNRARNLIRRSSHDTSTRRHETNAVTTVISFIVLLPAAPTALLLARILDGMDGVTFTNGARFKKLLGTLKKNVVLVSTNLPLHISINKHRSAGANACLLKLEVSRRGLNLGGRTVFRPRLNATQDQIHEFHVFAESVTEQLKDVAGGESVRRRD